MYSNYCYPTDIVGTKTIKSNVILYPDYYSENEINKAIQNNDCIFLIKINKDTAMLKDFITDLPYPGTVCNSIKYKLHGDIKNIHIINYIENEEKKQEKIIPPLFFLPKINNISENIYEATNLDINTASKISVFLLSKIIKSDKMSITFYCEEINEKFIEFCNILITKAISKQKKLFDDIENFFFKQKTSPRKTKINIVNTIYERSKRETYFTVIVKKEKTLKYPKLNINSFEYKQNSNFYELCNIFENMNIDNKTTEKNYIKKILSVFESNGDNNYFEKSLFFFLYDNFFIANKKNI